MGHGLSGWYGIACVMWNVRIFEFSWIVDVIGARDEEEDEEK